MTAATKELVQIGFGKLKNINIAVVDLHEGRWHEHSGLELGLVLQGNVTVSRSDRVETLSPGELMVINAYDSHILTATDDAKLLMVHLASAFGKDYFNRISGVEFEDSELKQLPEEIYQTLAGNLLSAAKVYFQQPLAFGLECAGWCTHLIATMLRHLPFTVNSDTEVMAKKKNIGRYQRISNYMEQHYRDKLTLTQLAQVEGITTAYMSRIFCELFHVPFQEYLSQLRLRKAMHLLAKPDIYLVDVCMECGFSDTRYLNSVCKRSFDCSAVELREKLLRGELPYGDQDAAAAQYTVHSDEKALEILEAFMASREAR